MRKIAASIALIALMSGPALAQTKQDPTASPGTGVNEQTLPKNHYGKVLKTELRRQLPQVNGEAGAAALD